MLEWNRATTAAPALAAVRRGCPRRTFPRAAGPRTSVSRRAPPRPTRHAPSGAGLGRAAAGTARLTARSGRFAAAKAHAYTHSGGAGESGLARMTELHASHTAGDTIMTLALAGTLFLNPQTAQARSDVATFLLLTMVPFVLVAPLIGPLLDRFSHGRRWAIGTTLAVRAFLCWVLAEAITNDSGWLFPAALGCLVASRAYTITRAAAVPRLLPPGTTLVKANSRVSMAGVVGAVVGGALGGVAMLAGPAWALRVAFVVFVIGTVQAIRLPARVDSSLGEVSIEDTTPIPRPRTRHDGRRSDGDPPAPARSAAPSAAGRAPRRDGIRPRTATPSRSTRWDPSAASAGASRRSRGPSCTPCGRRAARACSPASSSSSWRSSPRSTPSTASAASSSSRSSPSPSAIGNALGSVVGNVVRDQRPERIAMVSVLAATVCCIATGIWYGVWTLALLGFVQGHLGAAVQALLRRPRAARGPRERPHVGLRVVRDDAPGALGRRRHPRHRAPPQPATSGSPSARSCSSGPSPWRPGSAAAPPRPHDRERDVPDGRAVPPTAGDPRRTRRPRRAARPRGGPDRPLPRAAVCR